MSTQEVAWRGKILRLVWGMLIFFLIVLALAMIVYPDSRGHWGGYSFFHRHISALGMTVTHEGARNLSACLLFNIGLGATMLALIPFWYIRVQCLGWNRAVKGLGFLLCTGFSLGLIGVALTPYNLHADLHNLSVYSAFVLIVPGCLILVIGALPEYCSLRYKLGWVGFAVTVLLVQLVILKLCHAHVLDWGRITGPVVQKVNVGIFIVWVMAELVLYRRYLNRFGQVPEPVGRD